MAPIKLPAAELQQAKMLPLPQQSLLPLEPPSSEPEPLSWGKARAMDGAAKAKAAKAATMVFVVKSILKGVTSV